MAHKTVRMPPELLEAAKLAASNAGMSLADYMRFALRQAIDRHDMETRMASVEERIASQMVKLQRRIGQVHRAQQFQFALLDEYMKVALALEPDFPDERAKAAARAIGLKRHRAILDRIPGAVNGPLAQLLQSSAGAHET